MGQQMGYRSQEWNWPKEAMNRLMNRHFFLVVPVFDRGRCGIYSWRPVDELNEGIHLDLDTWIVPGQIRKANLCRGLMMLMIIRL